MVMKMRGENIPKIPLLPNNAGKKSVNDSGPTIGSRQASDGFLEKKERAK